MHLKLGNVHQSEDDEGSKLKSSTTGGTAAAKQYKTVSQSSALFMVESHLEPRLTGLEKK